ncbi:MAG: ABC transporter permease [Anaerolineae bacterium]|nr:ABC transporter permease [Anaerolineae bacterium]
MAHAVKTGFILDDQAAAYVEDPLWRWRGLIRLGRDLLRDKVALGGAIIVFVVLASATLAPLISPHDPAAGNIAQRLQPPGFVNEQGQRYILGTDQQGRDILSRAIHGARVSMLVGIGVIAMAGTVGTILGLVSGYYGGRVDDIIMRIVDTQTAFPGLLLALVIITMIGPSVRNIIIVLSINGWMVFARITRGIMLTIREKDYIDAARLVGARDSRIMFRHAFPNMMSPTLTLITLELARIILAEASLSFLGLGIQPPQSSWGLMIADGRNYITVAWWLVTFPGICIAITVFGVMTVANWLRTVTDPEQRVRATPAGTGSG